MTDELNCPLQAYPSPRGCVTPKQLKNLQEECEGDLEYVDGYEDLPAEWQVKVKRALEQQHVDDEDWKHGMSVCQH